MLEPKRPTVFVDRATPPESLPRKKFNVLLAPSYYWIRKEELPVKYEYQAKSLAPSIFDGILPEGEYQYEVIKSENEFLIFAYNPKEIIQNLSDYGIRLSQVNYFYFSQVELSSLETPLKANEKHTLINQNGIITAVPSRLIQNAEPLDDFLSKISLSGNKITLSRINLVIDQKTFNMAASVLLLFIALYTAQIFLIKEQEKALLNQRQTIFESFNLPSTTFQLNAIEQSLMQREKDQIELRNAMNSLFNTPRRNGEYFSLIEYDNNRIRFELVLNEPRRAEAVKNALSSSLTFNSIRVVGNTMVAEARL